VFGHFSFPLGGLFELVGTHFSEHKKSTDGQRERHSTAATQLQLRRNQRRRLTSHHRDFVSAHCNIGFFIALIQVDVRQDRGDLSRAIDGCIAQMCPSSRLGQR
jgi:hypothetical protein